MTSYKSPDDGVLIVEIDTCGIDGQDDLPEDDNGPIVRIYLNEDPIYENPPFPNMKDLVEEVAQRFPSATICDKPGGGFEIHIAANNDAGADVIAAGPTRYAAWKAASEIATPEPEDEGRYRVIWKRKNIIAAKTDFVFTTVDQATEVGNRGLRWFASDRQSTPEKFIGHSVELDDYGAIANQYEVQRKPEEDPRYGVVWANDEHEIAHTGYVYDSVGEAVVNGNVGLRWMRNPRGFLCDRLETQVDFTAKDTEKPTGFWVDTENDKERQWFDDLDAKHSKTYRIHVSWVQKGHTTFDPTGQREFKMHATWSTTLGETLTEEQLAAFQYGQERVEAGDWLNYKVEVLP